MTELFCSSCEVKLTRSEPYYRSAEDGWLEPHWFPYEGYKCLACPCCNFWIANEINHQETWEELENRTLIEHGDLITTDQPADWVDEIPIEPRQPDEF